MLIFLTQPPSSWSSSKPFCTSLQQGRAGFQWELPWWSDDRPHRLSPVLGTFSYFGWKPVLFLSCPTRLTRDVSFVTELPVLGLGLQKPECVLPLPEGCYLEKGILGTCAHAGS